MHRIDHLLDTCQQCRELYRQLRDTALSAGDICFRLAQQHDHEHTVTLCSTIETSPSA